MSEFRDVSQILGCGIYALYWRGELVYIGKSERLLARIYVHRNLHDRLRKGAAPRSNAKAIKFDKVEVMLVPKADLDYTERRLIEQHKPRYNEVYVNGGRRLTLEDIGLAPPVRPTLGLGRRV